MSPPRSSLAALAALSLAGCAYLLDDPYGSYLQASAAWTDLRAELGTSFALDTIEGMSIARAGSKEYLFARLEDGEGASVIRGLDPMSLELADFSLPPSGSAFAAAIDANAEFVVGTDAYFPSTMSFDAATPVDGSLVADISAARNYIFPSGLAPATSLAFAVFDSAWASLAASSPLAFPVGARAWRVARALPFADGGVAVLAFSGEKGRGVIKGAAYPSAAALASSTAPRSSAEIAVDSSQGGIDAQAGLAAWATADGVVAIASEEGGSFRFVRYDYDAGKEKDGYSVSSRHDARFYFEPSGRYWYLYERASGRLYRLRTWWRP